MELDQLRRQWQQPSAAPDVSTDAALTAALHARPTGLADRMRRNAWLETGFNVLVALLLPVVMVVAKDPFWRIYSGMMLVLAVGLFYYYYQKLNLLRRMAHAEVEVRRHLSALCAGLRQLLRFYYRLTLATGPVLLTGAWCYYFGLEYAASRLAPARAFNWHKLGGMAVFGLVFGAILQVGAVYGTRWYLQKLYGRHLDQLETSLRELDEPATPAAQP